MTELPNNLDTILHLGAGHGEELPTYLASDAQRILLVEPNPTLAETLRRQTAQDERVQILELAVTNELSLNQLNEYNLPEAASLYRPSGLRELYPGLRIIAQHAVHTITPEQLLAQFSLKGERNLLVIQTPGAELLILKTLAQAKLFETISHIWLTCPRDIYYENANRADDVLAELERAGYQIETEHHSQSDWPQWRLACSPMARKVQALELEKGALTEALKSGKSELEYTRSSLEAVKAELADARKDFDHQQQAWETQKQELATRLENTLRHSGDMDSAVAKLQAQESDQSKALAHANNTANQLRQKLTETEERLTALEAEHQAIVETGQSAGREAQSAKAQLQQALRAQSDLGTELGQAQEKLDAADEELKKHKTYLINRKKQLEEAEQKNRRFEQEIESLQERLNEQGDNAQRFEQLQAQLASVTQSVTQNISSHIDRKLARNTQQLENTLALQGYLQSGELPVKRVGTSFSAQLALYLAEKIETNQYDLIIEFGSGASTGFLARTVLKRATHHHREQQQLGHDGASKSGQELTFIAPDDDDLPKRIISFEHRKEQHAKLEQMLIANGLQQVVNLVHAPLVDYRHLEQHYLHYSCGSTLERIARLYEGRSAKFLILVNGPPRKAGPNAGFPTVPALLNTFGSATMDVVFGDGLREESHAIADSWGTLMEQRGIAFHKEVIDLETGATLMAINPA